MLAWQLNLPPHYQFGGVANKIQYQFLCIFRTNFQEDRKLMDYRAFHQSACMAHNESVYLLWLEKVYCPMSNMAEGKVNRFELQIKYGIVMRRPELL